VTVGRAAPATRADWARRLAGPGLSIRTGPFVYRLRADAAPLLEPLALMYDGLPQVGDGEFHDFEVELAQPGGWRRVWRPQVRFRFDGAETFEPLPLAHAYPLLEWAMNWCISSHVQHYLLIHAAVIERGGRAAVLPAPPGSGKSTLCAALVNRGWRLLSDEIALMALDGSGHIHALARPVSLKNRSIEVISAFAPEAVFNEPVHNTAKGTVAHMRAPAEHVRRVAEPALPAWVVFPRWQAEAAPRLSPRERAATAVELARNSFNYGTLGRLGFDTLADVVSRCECFDFEYGRLDDAVAAFDSLVGGPA
jgi:HprK-related kinase A